MGKLPSYFAMGKLLSYFAIGKAGFQDKPFYLTRNVIQPSLNLQRRIFPWLENCYGTHGTYCDAWRRECDMFMMGHDENQDNDDSTSDSGEGPSQGPSLVIVQEHGHTERARPPKDKQAIVPRPPQ